jgi:hypothetical protein
MKSLISNLFLTIAFICVQSSYAQTATELQATAHSFIQQGDYANAVLILNRATQMEPNNIEITKELAVGYYMQGDNNKALEVIKPLLDREDADDQCYQIAGNIYKQLELPKDCEILYRKGIKKFPESGPLYNELGELLMAQKDVSAIKQWEKGIEVDPNYSKNYYNACKYYYSNPDKVWCLLYGEIFVNMEPINTHTPEIKTILLESYKMFFINTDIANESSNKNNFTSAFIATMNKQSSVAAAGINPESLTMLRTRFILDWFQNYAAVYPFRLFDLQKQLLQEGMFDAYDQWIFGSVQNLAAYQNWTIAHSIDYAEFSRFQKSRVIKIPTAQYYH